MINKSKDVMEKSNGNRNMTCASVDLGEKIKTVRNWIHGPGIKLLQSQTSKPFNFDEAVDIRKQHEQFEFKCMKALETFAELCDYRKQSDINLEMGELDFMVQSFVEKLNKRTFFVVSCYTYFRLVEELWVALEDLQKKSKEVDTYDLKSIKSAISEIEDGVDNCELRLNGINHELERLKIIVATSDPDYLTQLEDGFTDTCRAISESTQSLKIRKLVLKKHAKLLECEDNVYESIGWIEELLENVEVMYQKNCVGRNQLEAENLLRKYNDIGNQAKATRTYCIQLLQTYEKLCEADGRRLPRNVGLSESRLKRVWPRLTQRLLEIEARTEMAENVYTTSDSLLNRVQEYLLELTRSPPSFDRQCGSPTTSELPRIPNQQRRLQLENLLQEFEAIKSIGLRLIDKLPKGLLDDDPMFNSLIVDEVIRMIRLKLYTLWIKIREYEYAILGRNTADHTTVSGLAPHWQIPERLSRSSCSTIRRAATTSTSSPMVPQRPARLHVSTVPQRAQEASSTPPKSQLLAQQDAKNKSTSYKTKSTESLVVSNRETAVGRADAAFLNFQHRLKELTDTNQKIMGRTTDGESTNIEFLLKQHDQLKAESLAIFTNLQTKLLHELKYNEESDSTVIQNYIQNLLQKSTTEFNHWISEEWQSKHNLLMNINTGNYLTRLNDLTEDLNECLNRLVQLIQATCLATNLAADFTARSSTTSEQILTESEIYQMNTISDEVNGMLQTKPAQEVFIRTLCNEIEHTAKQQYSSQVKEVHTLWERYGRELDIFKAFIENLAKGYNLIPQIKRFKQTYIMCMEDPKRSLSLCTSAQTDGRNLEQSISKLIKPDCLTPAAEELKEIAQPVFPEVNWLITFLKKERKHVEELLRELDMLVRNMRNTSKSPVDVTDVLPISIDAQPTSSELNYIDKSSNQASSSLAPRVTNLEDSGAKLDPCGLQSNTQSETLSISQPLSNLWKFTRPLKDIECDVQQTVVLECQFTGPKDIQSMNLHWFYKPFRISKTNNELTYGTKERVKLIYGEVESYMEFGLARLKLINVSASKAGQYICRLKDEVTNKAIKTSAVLNVRPILLSTPIEVTAQISNQSHELLDPVTFEITFDGFLSKPITTWKSNGKPIDMRIWKSNTDMTSTVLSSNKVHISDRGLYECLLTDPFTNFQLKANVELKIAPVQSNVKSHLFINDVRDVNTTYQGNAITIRCPLPKSSNKTTNLVVDWLHNKQSIYALQQNGTINFSTKEKQFRHNQTIWRSYIMEDQCVLATDKVHLTDQGEYTCRISIDNETYESTGHMNVLECLQFSEPLTNIKAFIGESMQLRCKLNHLDNASADQLNSLNISWFLNGSYLDTKKLEHLRVKAQLNEENQCVLSINKLQNEHVGYYRCELEFSGKKYSTECEVTVKESSAPIILTKLPKSTKLVKLGESITFVVNYEASSLPDVKWYKDNQLINAKDSHYQVERDDHQCTLKILNAELTDSGVYTVNLSNAGGMADDFTTIQIMEHSLTENQPVTTVQAKESKSVMHATHLNYDHLPSEMDKQYKWILYGPNDVKIKVGELVRLFCIIKQLPVLNGISDNANGTDDDTRFHIDWTHNGQILKPSDVSSSHESMLICMKSNYPTSGVHMLELRHVSMDSEGFYGITLWKPVKTDGIVKKHVLDEAVCWVEIERAITRSLRQRKFAPHILEQPIPDSLIVQCGNMVEFKYVVDGEPIPSFCWIKDRLMVIASSNEDIQVSQIGGNYTLTIWSVSKEYEGKWDFVCHNSQGVIIKSCQLIVMDVREISVSPATKTTEPSSTVTLLVNNSDSDQQVTATGGEKSSVEFTESNSKPTQVSLLNDTTQAPEFKSIFTDLVLHSGDTLCLSCILIGSPTPVVRWILNEQFVLMPTERVHFTHSNDQYSLIIENVCSADSGRYSVTAENIMGSATCTALVFIEPDLRNQDKSPISEPGYVTYRHSFGDYDYMTHPRIHKQHSSGTQTPERQRTAFVRSISTPTFSYGYSTLPNYYMNNKRGYICRNCQTMFDDLDFYGYNQEEIVRTMEKCKSHRVSNDNGHRTYFRSKQKSVKHPRGTSTLSRRLTGSTEHRRLKRHRSESSVIPNCPCCDVLILPIQRAHLLKSSDHIHYVQPKSSKRRQHRHSQQQPNQVMFSRRIVHTTCVERLSDSNQMESGNGPLVRQSNIKLPTPNADERQIPVFVESPHKFKTPQNHFGSLKNPKNIIDTTFAYPANFTTNNHGTEKHRIKKDVNPDGSYSMVESSDNDSL